MTVQRPARPPTPAQERVARLVAKGLEYKAIGVRLNMTPRTVRRHVEALALLIPLADDEEFSPYMRVQTWAYWELVVWPALQEMAA